MKDNKVRNILIGIIIALLLLFCFTTYTTYDKSKKVSALEESVLIRDVEIAYLKADLISQSKTSDSLKRNAAIQDSLLKIKDLQIANIKYKYDIIKGKIKELNLEESVAYLKARISNLDQTLISNHPSLILYNNVPMVVIDTSQTKLLNMLFINNDECNEELDSTISLSNMLKQQILNLNQLVDSQGLEIKICGDVVQKQDTTIKEQRIIISEKDVIITDLSGKIKTKNIFIRIFGSAAAILGVIAILK